jgi:endonuclease/exonuclease/phosphatase family metal-dependent hydrolase
MHAAPSPFYDPTGAPRITTATREQLAAITTRRALETAAVYRQHAAAIAAVTAGVEWGAPPRPAAPDARDFVRVVSWNLQRGIHLDGVIALLRTEPRLAEADVVLLNEVDLGMARSGNRHVAREIGAALGLSYVFGNSYLCLDHGDVRDADTATLDVPNELGLHGNAILSRFPLRRAENVSLTVTRDKFASSSEKRLGHKKALWAEIAAPGGPIRFAACHLDSIATPGQRAAQLADLLAAIPTADGTPLLLGGDLNTTTYDLGSLPRLAWNLAAKLVRGGFPHALHHYMHPWLLYERPVFAVLARHQLAWAPFNDLAAGTVRYEVGSFDSESKIREFLPEVAVRVLRWRLRPWGGVAPLRIDWFAGRGLRALGDDERVEAAGRRSRAPGGVARPTVDGTRLSDHDPIVVDVAR